MKRPGRQISVRLTEDIIFAIDRHRGADLTRPNKPGRPPHDAPFGVTGLSRSDWIENVIRAAVAMPPAEPKQRRTYAALIRAAAAILTERL